MLKWLLICVSVVGLMLLMKNVMLCVWVCVSGMLCSLLFGCNWMWLCCGYVVVSGCFVM